MLTVQETDLTKTENENASLDIQLSDYESKLEYLQKLVDEQNSAIEKQNALIAKSEAEIARNNHLIERKQTQIDQLNKKLSQMMAKVEGVSIFLLFFSSTHVCICECVVCLSVCWYVRTYMHISPKCVCMYIHE